MKIASLIFASLTALSASTVSHSEKPHWSYHGEFSPENWGKISKICSTGKFQTPINIITDDVLALPKSQDVLKFHNYKTSIDASVINNGHTIKITPTFKKSYENSSITVDGKRFKLLQFHMHTHSESTINGKQSDLVAHLVHQAYDGQLAVVAVFFDEGVENTSIKEYWNSMPLKSGGTSNLLNINIADILPEDISKYYTFMGSLTTPPCSENVKWFILKEKQTISTEQINALRTIYPSNFRPIQETNSRKIFEK